MDEFGDDVREAQQQGNAAEDEESEQESDEELDEESDQESDEESNEVSDQESGEESEDLDEVVRRTEVVRDGIAQLRAGETILE
jgi:hypothetical protein